MDYVVIVKATIDRSYAEWLSAFNEHREIRAEIGVFDIFQYPVIGEQSIVYAVRTDNPRKVHDTIYQLNLRSEIRESGFVVGSEIITICDALA